MIAANANNSREADGSARCAFCRTLFEQSGVRRLHVDLGAVPSEAASSDDGTETINGDDDENRSLARDAEKLAVAVANATFERNAEKIKSTAAEGQKWIVTQRRKKPTAGFPVLTALTQLAVGNMENYNACRQLEQKLVESRANASQLTERLQTLSEADQRERQNFEKIRSLEQERDDLRQSLTSTERSLRTTTSSLADATASLAESDTALAAAKAELAAREDIRAELEAMKAELEAAQTARDESRAALSKAKKELSSVKHELKQLRADMDHAAPHTLKEDPAAAEGSADASGSSPKKLSRRRSRKLSHSAPKAPATDDSAGPLRKLDGARPKKSRHPLGGDKAGDKTEDEGKEGDISKEEHFKSGEPTKSKGHSKDKERKERGKHRDKDHGEGKHKDKDNDDQPPPEADLTADSQPGPSDSKPSEKPHKSGKSRRKHTAAVEATGPPERSASAPPGTEAETQEALKISTDSLPHTKGESSKSPDPTSSPAASGSGSKNPPPATGPRRGLVEAFPAMRVLRRAMGRKANSPNASHDLGSASTVVNMVSAPMPSPSGSTSSAPAAATNGAPTSPPVTSPSTSEPFVMPAMPGSSVDPLQASRTGAYSYSVPSIENIAGFGIPGVVHEMSHGPQFGTYPMPPHGDPPRRFQESTTRGRGQSTPDSDPRVQNPLPRLPRTSEDRDGYDQFAWPYDSVWDQNRRGKGRDRDREDRKQRSGRRHLSNEWHGEEGVAPVRRYVAAEDVPNLSASSRHVFDPNGYGESPPAYPMYEHGILDSGMPRKSSFGHLRGMK